MHAGLNAVIVGGNPHIGILVHLAAAGVEKVIVVADLRESLGADTVRIIIDTVAGADESCLDQLSICAKAIPAVSAQQRRFHIDRLVHCQLAAVLCEVVLAVQLIQAVDHLHVIDGKVQLTVFLGNLLGAILQIWNEHLAVGVEVMHAGLNTVIVGGNPHIGVLVHLAVANIEEIIVVADLREPLGVYVISKVVGASLNIREAVSENVAILAAPVPTGFQAASLRFCCRVHIAASGGIH